jgi:hypothetical protein
MMTRDMNVILGMAIVQIKSLLWSYSSFVWIESINEGLLNKMLEMEEI